MKHVGDSYIVFTTIVTAAMLEVYCVAAVIRRMLELYTAI